MGGILYFVGGSHVGCSLGETEHRESPVWFGAAKAVIPEEPPVVNEIQEKPGD